jgi:hypothetical protein
VLRFEDVLRHSKFVCPVTLNLLAAVKLGCHAIVYY